jgi:hypothetical protein
VSTELREDPEARNAAAAALILVTRSATAAAGLAGHPRSVMPIELLRLWFGRPMALRLVPVFESSLSRLLRGRGIAVSRWSGGSRQSANLLRLSTSPSPTVLYVKESVNKPGFWGLTKNQLDRLVDSGNRWFGVFLQRSATTGYLLSGGQIELRIKEDRIRLAGDGDYKINEHDQFLPANRFERLEDLFPRLL